MTAPQCSLTIRVFGQQSQTIGVSDFEVDVSDVDPNSLTASFVLERIGECYEILRPSLSVSRLAVDHRYLRQDEVVDPDGEIALIGLISGG